MGHHGQWGRLSRTPAQAEGDRTQGVGLVLGCLDGKLSAPLIRLALSPWGRDAGSPAGPPGVHEFCSGWEWG